MDASEEGWPDLARYYAKRAGEYEKVYTKPERRDDLVTLERRLVSMLEGHDVLELACGTGYWTERIASVTRSILATDVNAKVLDIARRKPFPCGDVRFAEADAFQPDRIPGTFSAVFAGFWWSHIPRRRLSEFLGRIHRKLGSGGLAVFIDNRYVAESNHPIARTDADGNTYQHRRLEDGTEFEVLKNFPDRAALVDAIGPEVHDTRYDALRYYWSIAYRI